MEKQRVYISIYFEDAQSYGKKKRDLTLAFDPDDEIYERAKVLGSSGIKKVIGINSFRELLEAADKEDRSLSNFIKHKLKVYIENEKNITG